MSNLSNYFREMQLHRERMIDAYTTYQKELNALAPHAGSQFYESKINEL